MDHSTYYYCSLIIGLIVGRSPVASLACGRPGIPVDGFIREFVDFPTLDTFEPGTEITYRCNEEHKVLRGTRVRRCLVDGRWSGTRPWCDTNVAYGPSRLVWTGHWVDETNVITDGSLGQCYLFDRHGLQFHFQSYAFHEVTSIVLHIEPRTFVESDLRIEAGNFPCQRHISNSPDKKTLIYQCHSVSDHVLSDVDVESFLEFKIIDSPKLTLCEMEIYANPGQLLCGDPDVPANGDVTFDESSKHRQAHYQCRSGFDLVDGDEHRFCYGRSWHGTQPVCLPWPSIDNETTANTPEVNQTETSTEDSEASVMIEFAGKSDDTVLISIMSLLVAMAIVAAILTGIYVNKKCKKRSRSRIDFDFVENVTFL